MVVGARHQPQSMWLSHWTQPCSRPSGLLTCNRLLNPSVGVTSTPPTCTCIGKCDAAADGGDDDDGFGGGGDDDGDNNTPELLMYR